MAEFKDKIRAANGRVEFLYDAGGIRARISGFAFAALYQVAVSLDGRSLLAFVPAVGIGQTPTAPSPSVLTYIQSDEQNMWGRNCPACKKYFRTNHVRDKTFCPYCSVARDGLEFITQAQNQYITAYYHAFSRAVLYKKNTFLDAAEITDDEPAWHYSEEKLQTQIHCTVNGCNCETDILGEYGFCPHCGTTNGRQEFLGRIGEMRKQSDEVDKTISDRQQCGAVWESLTVQSLSEFEAFAKHLRTKLVNMPMTASRRKGLLELNFQKPLEADARLNQWFDIGLLEWAGNQSTPRRGIPQDDVGFIRKMIQRRHILIHNGGAVDQDYIDQSGDKTVRLGERVRIRSNEAKRFVTIVEQMAINLLDNIENAFGEM